MPNKDEINLTTGGKPRPARMDTLPLPLQGKGNQVLQAGRRAESR
jgi:hypothetical protein